MAPSSCRPIVLVLQEDPGKPRGIARRASRRLHGMDLPPRPAAALPPSPPLSAQLSCRVETEEAVRQCLAVAMLAVSSYCDIRARRVWDAVWVAFGAGGLGVSVLWHEPDLAALSLALGTAAAIAARVARLFPWADCLCLVALSAVLPYAHGIPTVLAVLPFAVLACSALRIGTSVLRNLPGLVRGDLFCGVSEPPYRKALAFFLLYRRRPRERFALRAQEGPRLQFRPFGGGEAAAGDFEGFVIPAIPAIPAMLACVVLLVFL